VDYKSLKTIVLHHDKLYYDAGKPVLSDAEYDGLYDQLVEMEKLQGWKDPDSPTIRIASSAGKIKHPHKLYSLKKVYDKLDIDSEFIVVTPKLDGVNLSITYANNSLANMLTRGDGEYGENVIHLSKVIKGIPSSVTENVTFVGEVVTDNEDVDNFRNYVAGALGLKSAKDAQDRNLRFIVHDVYGVEKDYLDRIALARSMGFATVTDSDYTQYPQDGIVYRVNSYQKEVNMGHTSKHPRFAVALKQKEHFTAATNLKDIAWTAGRSGVVTPVGIVDPVVLDGATVSRVILHNLDFVLENDLRPGDSILIERRITPQFVRVLKHSNYEPFSIQDAERSVGSKLKRIGPKIYMDKQDGKRLVEHFVKTMGIKGLGPASIEKLDISHPSELYDKVYWDVLGRNGEKVRDEVSRPKDYPTVLAALGIPGVGKSTALLITKHLPKFDQLHKIAQTPIKGIGPTTVENILSWLEVNEDWVQKLPYDLETDTDTYKSEDLADYKKICITGKLDMTKAQLAEHLQKFGFEVTDSLTKDCYALITAGEESIKTKQATKHGIPIFNYWNNRSLILKGMF
jgi:DNA ligase (NAD+)